MCSPMIRKLNWHTQNLRPRSMTNQQSYTQEVSLRQLLQSRILQEAQEVSKTKLVSACSTTRSEWVTPAKLMVKIWKRIKKIGSNIKEKIAQVQKLFSLSNTLAVHRVQLRITQAIILKSLRISISGQSKLANSSEFNHKSTTLWYLSTAILLAQLKTFLQELMLHLATWKSATKIKAQE